MLRKPDGTPLKQIAPFDRKFFDSAEIITFIGSGGIGGKAQGLVFIKDSLIAHFNHQKYPDFTVTIPRMTILATDIFDDFMRLNNLYEIAYSDERDDKIAFAFQRAELPAELVGDLRALITQVHTPLAIRSSSLLEDALYEPFAGVYATKMIPNNQFDTDSRFRVLVEAIKFVYASTFFREARNYIRMTKKSITDEKMAVIIQEVVGAKFGDRFYPQIAGVARSYNFYPSGHAEPRDGVVNLALGLGKTIVDGSKTWCYSPAYPQSYPPYKSTADLLKNTQVEFWAVNMGKPPEHDPMKETEYMVKCSLEDAETDGNLKFVASTYLPQDDRLLPGAAMRGPRVITFAPTLCSEIIPLNDIISELLKLCEDTLGREVEIEFAVNLDPKTGLPAKFGLLQVRPMFVSNAAIEVLPEELLGANVLAASDQILGNGSFDTICDVVYLKKPQFNEKDSRVIASQLETINRLLVDQKRPYLLIVYGRLGTTDPPFGIPVEWAQISGAKVIVETNLPEMNVELSQGSHFFHNVISFQVGYFSVPYDGKYAIRWDWLEKQKSISETEFINHVRLKGPLRVKLDGRNRRGVILYER